MKGSKTTALRITFCAVIILGLVTSATGQEKIRVHVEEVKDTRTTGDFFGGLEIKLKTIGEVPSNAKGVRFTPEAATDSAGTNLLKGDENREFDDLDNFNFNNGQITITVDLKNPPRRAEYVAEISGKLELFVPARDDNAVVTVKNFRQRTEPTVQSGKLEKANVELMVLTAEQYEQMKEELQEEETSDVEGALAKGLTEAFGAMFGGFGPSGADSVTVKCSDPDSRVVGIEFQNAAGEKIDTMSWTSVGDVATYEFSEKLPDDAQLQVHLMTPEAVVVYPLSVKEIVLP